MQKLTPQPTHFAVFLNKGSAGVWPVTIQINHENSDPPESRVQIRVFVSDNWQLIIPLSIKEAAELSKKLKNR